MLLHVAHIVPVTEAEGPGKRFALWFQGCPLRCPGCCNPEMLAFEGGTALEMEDILRQVREAMPSGIEGVTLLGGEPFAHAAAAAQFSKAVREWGLSVMVFSGYTLAELRSQGDPAVAEFLGVIDLLIDGRYLRDQPDTRRRWIGSTNQQIHFLTGRDRPDDLCWQQPNTLEIRLAQGELNINGFPARQAVGLWKQLDSDRSAATLSVESLECPS